MIIYLTKTETLYQNRVFFVIINRGDKHMTDKEYYSFISIMKDEILSNKEDFYDIQLFEKILLLDVTLFNKLIKHRRKTMGNRDFQNKLLLATDYFSEYKDIDKIVIGRIIFDIETYGETEKRMGNYLKWFDNNYLNGILFTQYKKLQSYIRPSDDEGLIDFSKIEKEYISGNHFKHQNFYYKSIIKDQVLEQLLRPDTFDANNYRFFIKLNNTFYSKERDALPTLEEATINPSNPKWAENFSIHKGLFEGAAYELLESNDDEICKGKKAFKDNDFLRGVRRIESIAKRENNGRFSMMIEELSIEDNILIGRCIHLDSHDPVGTDFFEITLNHIDYAINVYGENHDRLNFRIDKKEKYDADLRGHLFRIENYPLEKLPNLAYLLFKSKLLTEEWATNTFNTIKSPLL